MLFVHHYEISTYCLYQASHGMKDETSSHSLPQSFGFVLVCFTLGIGTVLCRAVAQALGATSSFRLMLWVSCPL